jgi:hypothetical protein
MEEAKLRSVEQEEAILELMWWPLRLLTRRCIDGTYSCPVHFVLSRV